MNTKHLITVIDNQRKLLKISKAELSRQAGISPQTYSYLLAGSTSSSIEKLASLAQIVGFRIVLVSVEALG